MSFESPEKAPYPMLSQNSFPNTLISLSVDFVTFTSAVCLLLSLLTTRKSDLWYLVYNVTSVTELLNMKKKVIRTNAKVVNKKTETEKSVKINKTKNPI